METLPVNSILQGDCREVLNTLPDNSVDLIFADPPYNLQLRKRLYRPDLSKVSAVNDAWDKFSSPEDYDRFTREWLTECKRVLKPAGTIWVIGTYHNIFRVGSILQDLNFWILNDIVWLKTNPMPNFRGVRFTNAHETMIWAQKNQAKQYTFNHHSLKSLNDDLQMRSDWLIPLTKGRERIKNQDGKVHSTQKPEALLYRVIMASSKPGDIILDPFFGTGTSGAVAKKLNRKWIGIEKDENYIKIAQERIDSITPAPEETTVIINHRREPRIPFGSLLECGLLQPGQKLLLNQDDSISATIQSDGKISCAGQQGSIHSLARKLLNVISANGWDCWWYVSADGEKISIDELRKTVRAQFHTNQQDQPGR